MIHSILKHSPRRDRRHARTALCVLAAVLSLPGLLAAMPTAQADEPQAKIVVANPVVNLGSVARGAKVTAEFEIENAGSAPLELRDLHTSCACAVGQFDQVIAPGAKGTYELEIDTSMMAGPSQTQATVGTNDPDVPTMVLTAKINSRSYIGVDPGFARYDVHQNFPGDGIVEQKVWSEDGVEFNVTGVRTEVQVGGRDLATTATFRPAEQGERRANTPGSQWVVSFQLPKDAPVGAVAGWLRVDTDHPQQRTAHLPVSGFVRPVIAVTPPAPKYAYKQSMLAEEPYTHKLTVKSFAADPIAITSLRSDVKGLELSSEPIQDGRVYTVNVTATGALEVGDYGGTLYIETDSDMSGTVEVPLLFKVEP